MNACLRTGSGEIRHFRVTDGDAEMLARRFTIVCLLMMLFGMGFAILVAEASRDPRPWEETGRGGCGIFCQSLLRN